MARRLSFLGIALSLSLAACGGALTYQLKGTEVSPGADGKVVATVDADRGMTIIDISAQNLTPPERLLDKAKSYVVWVRKDEKAQWTRVGALELDGNGRNGKANLTTTETAFDLEVTPEVDVSAASPSGKIVLAQRVQRN